MLGGGGGEKKRGVRLNGSGRVGWVVIIIEG